MKKEKVITLMQWLISNEELENTSGMSKDTAKFYLKHFKEQYKIARKN